DAAVDEDPVVALARLIADGDGGRVRQAIARAGDEVLEDVVGVERERLIALVEDTAAREVLAVKAHRDQSSGHRLRRGGERLLALPLAEVELRGRRHRDLDDAVGQLPRHHLIEPDAIEAWMVEPHVLEDALPGGGIERSFSGRGGPAGG